MIQGSGGNMVTRDLNFDQGEVTDVVAPQGEDILGGIAKLGQQYATAAAESKTMLQAGKAQIAFKQLDGEYRQKWADDPSNPEGLKWLQESRQQVIDELGTDVPSLMNRKWVDKTTELATQSDLSNDLWTIQQNRTNTVSNVNTSIKSYLDMANQDGRNFGAGKGDASSVMNYLTAGEELHSFGNRTLGKADTDKLLGTFDKDYVKSFVSGVAESSPDQAKALLDDPSIAERFTTEEKGEMIDQIAKVRRQQQTAEDLSVTVNNGALTDIVNDPNTTFYEKRARIDELDMAGSISPTAAAKARRVLSSQEDLDTQTSTPVMADLVNKMYDLNSIADTNSADYLRGVRNIQEEIMEKQANGELKAKDATTLNKQLSGLTSAKLSSATNSAGNEFYEANQLFKQLPPEYRGQATRQLFYAGDGKQFTKQQYKTQAQTIIDEINATRRQKAVSTVKAISMDDNAFLKANNISEADITETMGIYKLTREQVVAELRRRAAKKKE